MTRPKLEGPNTLIPRRPLRIRAKKQPTLTPGPLLQQWLRLRNVLARWIATKDEVFNRDMSLVVDRLTIANEKLLEQNALLKAKLVNE